MQATKSSFDLSVRESNSNTFTTNNDNDNGNNNYTESQISQTNDIKESQIKYRSFFDMVELPDSISIALKIGDYLFNNTVQITKVIGEGGQAIVYQGYDKTLNKLVAVKHYEIYDSIDIRIEIIENELEIMKSIIHKNIIQCFNFEKSISTLCQFNIVMEYLEMNLFDYLKVYKQENDNKNLPMQIVKVITRNILNGLGFLHSKSIIHRDLKPENILLSKDLSMIKIADFGVSTCIQNAQTIARRTRIGTICYMSPEVVSGKPYAYDADIWALGCIVYEMVSGVKPYESKNHYNMCLVKNNATVIPVSSPLEIADDDVLDIFYDKANRELLDFVQKCWRGNNLYRPTVEELLTHPFLKEE